MKAPLSFMFSTSPCTAGNVVIFLEHGHEHVTFRFKTFNGKRSKIKHTFLKLVYKAFNDSLWHDSRFISHYCTHHVLEG